MQLTSLASASPEPGSKHLEADLEARRQFRAVGRDVLYEPDNSAVHWRRISSALAMPGSEPLQGALADMLCACRPDKEVFRQRWQDWKLAQRLSILTARRIYAWAMTSDIPLPQVNRFATRWCVLASPALDGPRRSLLCGADDSRALAARAVEAQARAQSQDEEDFLDHCAGAHDTLAFMLARRTLLQRGVELGPRWFRVSAQLQGEPT